MLQCMLQYMYVSLFLSYDPDIGRAAGCNPGCFAVCVALYVFISFFSYNPDMGRVYSHMSNIKVS